MNGEHPTGVLVCAARHKRQMKRQVFKGLHAVSQGLCAQSDQFAQVVGEPADGR